MKRILLALLLALAGTAAHAYDFKFDGIYYNILSDGVSVEVTSGSSDKYSGAINIPSSVTYSGKTYSVTSIGSDAFYGCSGLTSVTIPNSVTSIGGWAFKDCSGLVSIVVKNGNSIYDSRNGCNAIIETATNTLISGCMNTVIPNSVTSLGYSAFYGCSGLTSLTIPTSVTSIGECAFAGCSGLTSVTISNSVTTIGNWAFSGCSGLTSVTIPTSVTEIGEFAFNSCSSLTAVTIPNSVTSIGDYAFEFCSGLTSVTIGSSVTSIGERAFYRCSGLTSVVFNAENCTMIGSVSGGTFYTAFHGCTSISSLTIGEGVKTIPDYAFKNLSGLTSVTIPNSVTSIGKNAFVGCSSMTSVVFNAENCTDMGGQYPAFINCTSISTLTIGASVKNIPTNAFYNCSGLTGALTIPNSVTSIGSGAFYGCSGLTGALTIPNSVTSIGENAFNGAAQVTEILLGESVANIGASAFAGMGRVAKITSLNPTPPVCTASSVFQDVSMVGCKLYVPAGTKTTYAETYVWWDFTNIYELDGVDVESITLDAESLTMPIGSSTTITYTIAPDNATTTALEWSVSNPAVASIVDHNDGTATVKALSIGEATITAHTLDGSNLAASCVVKVGSAGVGDFDAADIEIFAAAEGIVVKGAPADCIIDVYTAAGVLVYHGYDSLIPIRNHGIYFVFVAGVKAKVVL